MKTLNKSKLILLLFAAFILLLNSCKKTNIDVPATQNAADAKAAILKAVKERYGNTTGIIVNVNKDPEDLFYRNVATGNMVKIDKSNTSNALCNYNCSNTTNPANLHLVYTLNYIQRNYLCESSGANSDLNVSWTISVPFTPLTTFGLNTSTGTLKVTDPGATLHTYSGLAITIRTIGADPGCGANTLYEIRYKAVQVPDSYFGAGMTMDASLSLYNNCALVGNLITTGDVSAADAYTQAHLPCYRVDKLYVNPPGGGTSYATVAGGYILCTNPSGFSTIDYHQLEYRLVTSGSSLEWVDQSSSVYWGVPVGSGSPSATINPSTGVSNLLQMTASSGTWLVRYRNVKTNVCGVIGSSPGADWGNHFYWFVEVWTI